MQEGETQQISKQLFDYFCFTSHLYENLFGKTSKQAFKKHLKHVMITLCNYATSIVCFQSSSSEFSTPNVVSNDTIAQSQINMADCYQILSDIHFARMKIEGYSDRPSKIIAELHLKYLQTIAKVEYKMSSNLISKIERNYTAPILALPWTHHKEPLSCISWSNVVDSFPYPVKITGGKQQTVV